MNERKLFAFTETLVFTEDLLDITDDETLYAIQNALLTNPLLGNVIKGTSGARKGRIGNPKNKSGKSVGFRFIYIYLPKMTDFIYWQFTAKRTRAIYPRNKPKCWVR